MFTGAAKLQSNALPSDADKLLSINQCTDEMVATKLQTTTMGAGMSILSLA